MPKFAANLSMMFQEHDFLDRFDAAADAGFKAVEFLFPYDFTAEEIKSRLDKNHLDQALFNLPPGDWDKGEKGLAALPGREAEFKQALSKALEYSEVLGNKHLHVMSGIPSDEMGYNDCRLTLIENLKWAAPLAAEKGKCLLLEPINNIDIPGYFLNFQGQARGIISMVGADNLRLQFDLYHVQIMEGNIAVNLRNFMDIIAHMQIAGVPGRHEPNVGEINYPFLFDLIDELGYDGWIGCEYVPKDGTMAGLGWMEGAGS